MFCLSVIPVTDPIKECLNQGCLMLPIWRSRGSNSFKGIAGMTERLLNPCGLNMTNPRNRGNLMENIGRSVRETFQIAKFPNCGEIKTDSNFAFNFRFSRRTGAKLNVFRYRPRPRSMVPHNIITECVCIYNYSFTFLVHGEF